MNKRELSRVVKYFTLRELNYEYQVAKTNNNQQDIKILDREIKRRRNNFKY